jgi:hypothetical protein
LCFAGQSRRSAEPGRWLRFERSKRAPDDGFVPLEGALVAAAATQGCRYRRNHSPDRIKPPDGHGVSDKIVNTGPVSSRNRLDEMERFRKRCAEPDVAPDDRRR